jgi:hypothetical protein
MDDTTLGDSNLSQIKQVQHLFETFHGTGLETLRHNCCKVRVTLQDDSVKTIQSASWAKTFAQALSGPRKKLEYWNENWKQISKANARKIKNKTPEPKLDKFYTAKCTCKCKTTLICSNTPTTEQLRQIDDMPFGARIISTEDITLGLILHNKTILATIPEEAVLFTKSAKRCTVKREGATKPKLKKILHKH